MYKKKPDVKEFFSKASEQRKIKQAATEEDDFRSLKSIFFNDELVRVNVTGWADSGFTVTLPDHDNKQFKSRHRTVILDEIRDYLSKIKTTNPNS